MKKRIIALLLTLCMMVSLLPAQIVFAENSEEVPAATAEQVVEAETDRCRVRITYPDVKTTFLEMLDELPENLEQHDVDTFYDQLREKVTGGKLPVLETSLDLAIMTNSAGETYIEWTPQAQNAMTGGLYEAFYEEADGA